MQTLIDALHRHELVYEKLLKRLSDKDLSIPPEGMTVAAIHTKAPLHLTSREAAWVMKDRVVVMLTVSHEGKAEERRQGRGKGLMVEMKGCVLL
eukprot:scaffold105737_cov21-Tisochrysis_lutea.AAC.2